MSRVGIPIKLFIYAQEKKTKNVVHHKALFLKYIFFINNTDLNSIFIVKTRPSNQLVLLINKRNYTFRPLIRT
jgi:hypothetical protein